MTLDLALCLDHDSVRLLRRAGDAEAELGSLRLDDPNFDARLSALRNGIGGGEPDVEVMLPRSLVLFLDVGEAGEDEVQSLVEDETPCSIDDLVIGRNGGVAAAVERATLQEAREFARTHGFRPASFSAHPGNGAAGPIAFRFEPAPPISFRSHRAGSDRVVAPEPEVEEQPPAATDTVVFRHSAGDDPAVAEDVEAEAPAVASAMAEIEPVREPSP
jgi:hypothetical protein